MHTGLTTLQLFLQRQAETSTRGRDKQARHGVLFSIVWCLLRYAIHAFASLFILRHVCMWAQCVACACMHIYPQPLSPKVPLGRGLPLS